MDLINNIADVYTPINHPHPQTPEASTLLLPLPLTSPSRERSPTEHAAATPLLPTPTAKAEPVLALSQSAVMPSRPGHTPSPKSYR
jgi:hypothetical protein